MSSTHAPERRGLFLAAALVMASTVGAAPAAAVQGAAAQEILPDTAAAVPGAEFRVWLVTAEPGDAVWERFGHNAIRVLDTRTGQDVAFNWGIFSFDQPGFIARFLKGQMLYMMAGFRSEPMVASYTDVGRDVVLQELALSPAQKSALVSFLEWNAQPENREYRYDYFRDNCSTRVRDALDSVLDGALAARFGDEPTGTSYRWHIRRLTRMDPFLYTGMDVLLGSPGDRPITVWEEMFLPNTLRDAVRQVSVVDEAGVERPLVADEVRVGPGTRAAPPSEPPTWLGWYALLGLAMGATLAWTGARGRGAVAARRTFAVLAVAWSALAGLVGTLLVLVLFTDHDFMTRNFNLLLASPLSLALVPLLALSRPGARRWAPRLSVAVLVLAAAGLLIGLLPGVGQQNAIFLALAVPAHLGLWWGVRSLAK